MKYDERQQALAKTCGEDDRVPDSQKRAPMMPRGHEEPRRPVSSMERDDERERELAEACGEDGLPEDERRSPMMSNRKVFELVRPPGWAVDERMRGFPGEEERGFPGRRK